MSIPAIDTAIFATGLVHLAPAILFFYLGIWRWQTVFPGFRRLTIWGLAGLLMLDRIRLGIHWIVLAFGGTVFQVTGATELVISVNVSLAIFLIFAWDERIGKQKYQESES